MDEDTDIRRLLHERLARIDSDRSSSAAEREPVMLDQSRVGRLARMDAMQVQAMAEAQDRRRRVERYRVKEALDRLERGDWGICTGCGETIGSKRLAFDPTIETCIRCASAEG